MPIKYRKNNNIYNIYLYENESDLTGEGVSTSFALRVRGYNGIEYYVGLTTDASHPAASDVKVTAPNGTIYYVLTHSKQVEGEISE